MSYRKILVPVDSGDGAHGAVETAFALAGVFGAHVEGLHIRVEPTDAVPYVGEGMSGALVQELIELTERESVARAAVAREMFERLRLAAGVPVAEAPAGAEASACWLEEVGHEADAVVRAGQLADLIVVSRSAGEAMGSTAIFTAVLFETGRPVLVVGGRPGPAAHPVQTGAPRRVVIAWKHSAEAARSVAAAMPLLARAERVTAVCAKDEDEQSSALSALATYLAWHGIAAERRLLAPYPSVGEALAAAAIDADLVVMGGYSHSRLRELILGGVTRHMLERTTIPLLLAH